MRIRAIGTLIMVVMLGGFLANCGGGGGGQPAGGTSYYDIGGVVSGLTGTGSLLLQNNGGDDLTVINDGNFRFATRLTSGATYSVGIATNNSGKACSLYNAAGTVPGANVTSVFVNCYDVPPVSAPTVTSLDVFEDDNIVSGATPSIAVGELQLRTLYGEGDVDVIKVDLQAGTTYEVSVNKLSAGSDTWVYLLDTDGTTTLVSGATDTTYSDDYLGSDSMIRTTPSTTGTYYIEVMSYNKASGGFPSGVGTYSLHVHEFVDADGDGFSNHYDCRDDDSSIHPSFLLDLDYNEVPGDGIDQDCSGTDELAGTTADKAEPDNDKDHAKELAQPPGDPFEIISRLDIFAPNSRTIHAAGDKDWFTFTLPAKGKAELYTVIDKVAGSDDLKMTIYESDGATLVTHPSYSNPGVADPYFIVENSSGSPATYYVVFEAADGVSTGFYVPYVLSFGTDADGDNRYTLDLFFGHDCNDADPAVYAFAPNEIAGDLKDTNCDGYDDN